MKTALARSVRRKMKGITKRRLQQMIKLIMDANDKAIPGTNFTIEFDRYNAVAYIYLDKKSPEGYSFYSYNTDYPTGYTREHNDILTQGDPGLKKTEEHIRRLLDELDGRSDS